MLIYEKGNLKAIYLVYYTTLLTLINRSKKPLMFIVRGSQEKNGNVTFQYKM
jgi:hypothetical protein